MNSGAKIGHIGTALLVACSLLLGACSQDANSFRALGLSATATGPDLTTSTNPANPTSTASPAIKVMVVGDVASPALSDQLGSRNFDVTNVPYTLYEASEIDMAGDYIVWSDDRNGNLDIYGYQISTATEFPISTAGGTQRSPKISGDYVVWEDYRNGNADIYAYRVSTGTVFAITTAAQNQRYPQIDGDYVVWQDERNGDADIYAYQFSTGTELPVSTATDNQWYPQISGDYIVWQSYQGGVSDIHGYQISSASSFVISSAGGSQYDPAISGNYVVWVDNRNGSDDIYGYNLATSSEFLISAAANQQQRPRVAGDYAVWQDYRNGNYDIYAYRFSTTAEIPVAVASGTQTFPVIHGDFIAWQDDRSGNNEIYAYQLSTGTESRITDHVTAQSRPALSDNYIGWLDGRRGLVDVMFRQGVDGANQVATSGWTTPAGVVTDFGDNQAVVLGSDIFSDEVLLQVFDAADQAGLPVLGLGGTGTSLASALAGAGRYGISVTPASGCSPTDIVADKPSHAVFTGLATGGVMSLESTDAVTGDELAITTNAADAASPTDWQTLASFSGNMCNAAQPALVAFTTTSGTPVLLEGSAGVADKYGYWSDSRWNLLVNELTYLAGS